MTQIVEVLGRSGQGMTQPYICRGNKVSGSGHTFCNFPNLLNLPSGYDNYFEIISQNFTYRVSRGMSCS